MASVLIYLGLSIAFIGLVALVAGAPDWALGLNLGAALIQSGTIAIVGGLILSAIGLVLRSLMDLIVRLDAPLPVAEVQVAPVETKPTPPAEVAVSLAVRASPAREPEAVVPELASAPPTPPEEAPVLPRPWPPSTATARTEAETQRQREPLAPPSQPREPAHPLRQRYSLPAMEPPVPPTTRSAPPSVPEPEAEPEVKVLRSGIIGGMAYTLYSDGSIEAELPGGTMRFATLDELRDHVARNEMEAELGLSGPAQKQ